ncbi:MAG TPA: amidohydrolase family protein [Gaiellaceae bacterium]|nr:amidohydrolase family protein [Gaiellaceae bacterium]
MDAREKALALMVRYDGEARSLIPAGADIFDAHLHLGNDIDGMVGDYDQLEAIMTKYGISRAFMFCLDEPDRHPGFTAANDRTLAFAERSAGRLIPFVRLDLDESPIEEARRCLDAGARGIKLHPRAQKFTATDERLAPVFEIAAERRVPILIHGGRGLPPIAEGLRRLVDRFPEASLIIAHAGIADMAALADCMAGRKGVFFDTSTWSPIDLLDFYRQIPPEQVLYASDFPYGQQPSSLLIALKTARLAGYSEEQLRAMLAGNANALADGDALPEPTTPIGSDTFAQTMQLARIHQYLSMAMPLLWTRQPDTLGVLGLAINVCAERNGHEREVEGIRELLETARELWAEVSTIEDEADRLRTMRLTHRLIHVADVEAVTAGA